MKSIFKTALTSLMAGMLGAYIMFLVLQPSISSNNAQQSGLSFQYGQKTHYKDIKLNNEDFVQASANSAQSVVYVKTLSRGRSYHDPFEWYFGRRSEKVTGSGSGVIFSKDGYIITNNHVVDGAESIEVIHEKRTYKGTIIGKDPSTDLALIKIEAKNLPAITLGRSSEVQVGEWVLAVGNPFNLTSTVTAGIVSAKGRNLHMLRSNSRFAIESFIQTDAAINPGNSGGALVNSKGELIGINTAIYSHTGSYTGYGFAVPVDIVAKVIGDLIEYGEVQKAFLGVEVREIDTETAKEFELKDLDGVVVSEIITGGAASMVGIKKGDVILKINQDPINTQSSFDEQMSKFKPGDRILLTYKQEGKLVEKQIQLTNQQGTTGVVKKEIITSDELGADLEVLPKFEREKLGIKSGVRVLNIKSGFFRSIRLAEGFVITRINNIEISSAEQVVSIFTKLRGRVAIEGINRNGEVEFLTVSRY